MGKGNAASADRFRAEPLTPNFSPVSGTVKEGLGGILATLEKCDLHRFAAGVITDICLDEEYADENILISTIEQFVSSKGAMATLAYTLWRH